MKPLIYVLPLVLAGLSLTSSRLRADEKSQDKDKKDKKEKAEVSLWVLDDLGATLPGSANTNVRGISSTGYVAGDSTDPETSFGIATRWSPAGAPSNLGAAANSYATAVNGLGILVGVGAVGFESHAMMWTGTTTVDLGSFGGTESIALGINNKGQIVGQASEPENSGSTGFIWHKGAMRRLSPPRGWAYSQATGVNNNGEACGNINDDFGAMRSVRWNAEGKVQILNSLGVDQTYVTAINDDGVIVGQAASPDGASKAVKTDGKKLVVLPSLGGVSDSANSINNHGDIVGYCTVPVTNEQHAVLWTNGVLIDLSTLPELQAAGLARNSSAAGINDNGDIAGVTYDDVLSQNRAWRLRRVVSAHH